MESDVCLGFLFAKPENKSPGGLPVSTTSSMFFKVQGENLEKMFTSPMKLLLAPDINQSLYCQLLCGLIRSEDVTQVFAALAITLVEALRLLEEAWSELADDVQTGTLNSKITDPTLRSSLSLCLRPNLKLAQSIRKECTADNAWCGIVERLWPKTKVIVTITTGGMAPYAPAVRKYGGSVPIVSGDYVCTECVLGFNLDPFCPPESVSFTIHPEYAYYEFLHYPQKLTDGSTVKLVDVKVGEEYELVVSTWSGLYRYKVGDIVRVTGFHNFSPNISFVHRLNAELDIAGERSTEAELQVAVQKSQHCLPASQELVDFTCHQDGQRYLIFWEIKNGDSLNPMILETCCCVLDTSLTERYKQRRENGLIGPLRLCIVRGKTFKALQQYSLEKGINPTQYKTPRCITSPEMIAILQAGNAIHALFAHERKKISNLPFDPVSSLSTARIQPSNPFESVEYTVEVLDFPWAGSQDDGTYATCIPSLELGNGDPWRRAADNPPAPRGSALLS
ncbi:probable indole-3-acetic acid-amido synthetase GH3.9 [Selaginella moellendorffii]|uniref:probable indole-3-acetic acid-amido synthetase GH3.9 n=1 Tax=Selaginella moellendorffii TaxID=88036 RepID=UPI000D1C37FA|nr:probable indole-3-acetic acid-amido synthetase GH3.9 [Selaginella moellendorffii]|eukprot:XP_024531125.1 probable indole-3-acetic acid-amido synthetase GH3.9 [Selaginella moellendorffii]